MSVPRPSGSWLLVLLLLGPAVHTQPNADAPGARRYRTLNDRVAVRQPASIEDWQARAGWLREHVLASAGLLPMPERGSLNAVVFGERTHTDYRVSKVYFESQPGLLVTGNLYTPVGSGPFPAIVSPHGHWPYGRFENSASASVPGRAINLARQGFVVFTYDMIGYNDSRWHPHTPVQTSHGVEFGGRRENLWGLSLAGLQLWNSIRAVDFLESLPVVDRTRIGATGASGGGTQTFLLAAVDDRVAAAAPVNMISLHMQGGCLCENMPGLRLDTDNVELAALMAPRPLLMVSATGDWTRDTMEREYPEMRRFYELFGAGDRVHAVRVDAEHNYNRESREAVYAWMARWLKGAPSAVTVPERDFQPDPLPDLMVFADRPPPDGVLSTTQLTERWIAAARQQLTPANEDALRRALRHVLGVNQPATGTPGANGGPVVVLATDDPTLEGTLKEAGFRIRPVTFTPFDVDAAAAVQHFETYNRTAPGQRVADLVAALINEPGAVLVADGDAGLAGVLAAAVVPVRQAILDVGRFDLSSDAAFVERLYIPGIRRAGDFHTAAAMAQGRLVLHNGGDRFRIEGLAVRPGRLTTDELLSLLGREVPGVRNAHSMAFDANRGVTLMYGGADAGAVKGDLWSWNGEDWTREPWSGPPPRTFAAMAWDTRRGQAVLFGGRRVLFGREDERNTVYGDTWLLEPSGWRQIGVASPPARTEAGIAYDTRRAVVVLFGGYEDTAGSITRLGDTWEWNGTRWELKARTGPAPRSGMALAYDPSLRRVVLFGGNGGPRSDTWTWDGTRWERLVTNEVPGRFNSLLQYFGARAQLLRTSGWNGRERVSDTWILQGSRWDLVTRGGPAPRNHSAVAYDAARQRLVLYGGHDGSRVFGDVWEWDGARWEPRLSVPPEPRFDNGH